MKSKEVEKAISRLQYIIKVSKETAYDIMYSEYDIEKTETVLNYIKELERELKIVDEYASLLWDILCDYDGYYDPETKQGSLGGLASLVDEAMNICDKIRDRDTTSVMYEDVDGKKFNILHEEITDKK